MSTQVPSALMLLFLVSGCAQGSRPNFPRFSAEIPSEFHGRWDELVEDDCNSRESRFALGPTSMHNFEVVYEVVNVVQRSQVEIDVNTRLDPEFGGPADEIWSFKLAQGGNALSAPDGKPPFYKRCPALPEIEEAPE